MIEPQSHYYASVMISAQTIMATLLALDTQQVVEHLELPVSIGQDIFTTGAISPTTVNHITQALLHIQAVFKGDGCEIDDVFATHSVDEALNATFVREQLQSRTHLPVRWLNNSQESYYRTLALYTYFPHFKDTIQNGTLVADISSGTIQLTAFNQQAFVFSRSIKLGPLRVNDVLKDVKRTQTTYLQILQDYIASRLRDFTRLLPLNGEVKHLILTGSSLALLDYLIPHTQRQLTLTEAEFTKLARSISHSSDQYLQDHYQLPDQVIPQVLPSLSLVQEIVDTFKVQQITVSNLHLLDGRLVDAAWVQGQSHLNLDPHGLTVTSALNLANHFEIDHVHQQAVTHFATILFDQLQEVHQLPVRARLLLELAAILSDIGSYVETHHHYYHSDYLIRSSEILGLSNEERQIVAAVARYHSADSPDLTTLQHEALTGHNQILVAKLAALLRLADALDASRQQRIRTIKVQTTPHGLELLVTAREACEFEQWTFFNKAKFFNTVFGIDFVLKECDLS